ncbi:hypothetical protein [Piscinibacter terrae]|nr:hypothetical protein [Albitalea terrae]
MKTTFNDGIGSRGLHHINLLAARTGDGKQVIFKFEGQALPGVVQIIKSTYQKNGKWSKTEWEIETPDGVLPFTRSQSWGTGNWLDAQTWVAAIEEFTGSLDLEPNAVERFIRATWQKTTERLDKAELEYAQPAEPILQELLRAQEELAAAQRELAAVAVEVSALEKAEASRIEAQEVRDRASKARDALSGKKKMSLDELKALVA